MLKTAATRMYWKQETKNSAEFSKFVASSLSPTVGVSVVGGLYLFASYYTNSSRPNKRVPFLSPNPEECPELHSACYDNLPNDAREHLGRDEIRSGALVMDEWVRESTPH